MYRFTIVTKRKDTSHEFYLFQTEDQNLMVEQLLFRQHTTNAPGFIAQNISISPDKLTLISTTDWLNQTVAEKFRPPNRGRYDRLLLDYLRRNDHRNVISRESVPDPRPVKARKIAQEVTEEEAARLAADIIKNYNKTPNAY
jgi:hypothetical protein